MHESVQHRPMHDGVPSTPVNHTSYMASPRPKSPEPSPQIPDIFNQFSPEHGNGGFLLDYVIQQIPSDNTSGPNVMDVLLLKADLCWPYIMDIGWVMDIADVYSGYFFAPTCCPYLPQMAPDNWFYINVILSKSQVFIPVGPEWRRPRNLTPATRPQQGGIMDSRGIGGFLTFWWKSACGLESCILTNTCLCPFFQIFSVVNIVTCCKDACGY